VGNVKNTILAWFGTRRRANPDTISSFLEGFLIGLNSSLESQNCSEEELRSTLIATGSVLRGVKSWIDSSHLPRDI
jgi:hypothetical protein